jgi:predicted Rossmann fold nucleotide-binding protein DprA/Smf involved in DNA uptake
MDAPEIRAVLSLPSEPVNRIAALLRRGGQLAFELERLASRGITLMTRADDAYPQLLKERLKRSAPPALYLAGDTGLLSLRAGAVVGSRNADPESLEFATALARRLAADGSAVVSGAARGVDTAAMLASLDAGGQAIGIVADSLEKAVRRQDFRAHISEGSLLLLSAYHPNARFSVGTAMRRNRLIYCLSDVAFVVASGASGGTREGALENLKASWVPTYIRIGPEAPAGNASIARAGAIPLMRDELDEPGILLRLAERGQTTQLVVELVADERDHAIANSDDPTRKSSSDRVVASSVGHDSSKGGTTRNSNLAAPSDQQMHGAEGITTDAFELVWSTLAEFLEEARTLSDVRSHLALEPSQARAWISRGVAEGRLLQLERPRRYIITPAPSPSLFDN